MGRLRELSGVRHKRWQKNAPSREKGCLAAAFSNKTV